jgi:hypothetical protein
MARGGAICTPLAAAKGETAGRVLLPVFGPAELSAGTSRFAFTPHSTLDDLPIVV